MFISIPLLLFILPPFIWGLVLFLVYSNCSLNVYSVKQEEMNEG